MTTHSPTPRTFDTLVGVPVPPFNLATLSGLALTLLGIALILLLLGVLFVESRLKRGAERSPSRLEVTLWATILGCGLLVQLTMPAINPRTSAWLLLLGIAATSIALGSILGQAIYMVLSPKWRHHDSAVRLSAIQKLSSEEILCRISRTDPSWNLRGSAIARIRSDSLVAGLLLETATPLSGTARVALGNLECAASYRSLVAARLREFSNKELLHQIALDAPDYSTRLDAARVLRDVGALQCIARSNSADAEIRLEAAQLASDERGFVEIATCHRASESVKKRALALVTEEGSLEQIAVARETSEQLRVAAIKRIGTQAILERVALSSWGEAFGAALDRITDGAAIGRVAIAVSAVSEGKVRNSALQRVIAEKLSDQSILLKIALHSKDHTIAAEAIKRITDDETLVRIVMSPSLTSYTLRRAAINQMASQANLVAAFRLLARKLESGHLSVLGADETLDTTLITDAELRRTVIREIERDCPRLVLIAGQFYRNPSETAQQAIWRLCAKGNQQEAEAFLSTHAEQIEVSLLHRLAQLEDIHETWNERVGSNDRDDFFEARAFHRSHASVREFAKKELLRRECQQ